MGRINEELEYAQVIMRRVHCKDTIVSNLAMEETAGLILDYQGNEHHLNDTK